MKICSFEDIKAIDEELASFFLRPDEAVNWIYAVENGIKEWIGKHNKQYWEVVRYVSEKRGILGKLKKDRKTVWLTREDFARVLLTFCPNAFEKGETVRALKSSMDYYKFATSLKKQDKLLSGHVALKQIKDVEDLLDQKPLIESDDKKSKPTLVDLLEEYLRREVDEQSDGFPRSKVCIRAQYDGISPAISVETYKSEQFLHEHRPSHIDAYEFIDGVLEQSKLNEFTGQYQGKHMKLYIVSSAGLLPQIRALAIERYIGYVRINPNSKMTSKDYILPRSIEDYTKQRHELNELAGVKPMTSPLLIMDDLMLTSSLADVLSEHGVAVKKHRLLIIPYLSDDEIEKRANEFTKNDVEIRIQMLRRYTVMNIDLSLDPFVYADLCGLGHNVEVKEDTLQLGRFDIEKKFVTLNSKGLDNYNRYRFTMAHELGHYILHTPLFKEQRVVSVGESEDTLTISKSDLRRLENQANKFASYLLMPKQLVYGLFVYYFEQYVHKKYGDKLQPLYYNPNQPETWPSYNNVVVNMARVLNVSLQAMNIRLQSLGLLNQSDR